MFGVGIMISYCVDECLDILDAETEGDDHRDTKDTVESDAPHHGYWKIFRCIFELFAHVCTGISTDKRPQGGRQADKATQTLRPPATTVVEVSEDLFGGLVIGHDPEDDQEREEAEDVGKENDSFSERQVACAPDIERNDQEGECEHEERDLPLSRECCVGIASGD